MYKEIKHDLLRIGEDMNEDYFSLFGISVSYEIDINSLRDIYNKKQEELTAVILQTTDLTLQKNYIKEAADLVHAYNSLLSPYERAIHICKIRGHKIADIEPQITTSFRMASMTVIKMYEEATDNKDNYQALRQILLRITNDINEIVKDLEICLEEDDPGYLQDIANDLSKLRFYLEYQEKIQIFLYEVIQRKKV